MLQTISHSYSVCCFCPSIASLFYTNVRHVFLCFVPSCMLVKIICLAAQCSQALLLFCVDQTLHSHYKLSLLTMLLAQGKATAHESCQWRLRQGFAFFIFPLFFSPSFPKPSLHEIHLESVDSILFPYMHFIS